MHTTDSSEQNAEVVRRFIRQVQAGGDLDALTDYIDPEFVDHTRPPGVSLGVQGVREQFAGFHAMLQELDVHIVRQVAAGDVVSTFKVFTGVHVGDFLGIPASGQRVELPVQDMVRMRNGKIVEHWGVLGIAPLLVAGLAGAAS
jgi:predicted ester cyclase